MKRRKDYIVTIIAKNYKQDIQVKAESKEEAENMVDNVLLGCDYFVLDSKDEYKLKIRKYTLIDKFSEKNYLRKIKRGKSR